MEQGWESLGGFESRIARMGKNKTKGGKPMFNRWKLALLLVELMCLAAFAVVCYLLTAELVALLESVV